jgi:putative FmdB family regulatory protein
MPIYDYECRACGESREEIRLYPDRDADGQCVCGGALRRVPSLPAVQAAFDPARVRQQLERRSAAYDQTGAGQAERAASIKRVLGQS